MITISPRPKASKEDATVSGITNQKAIDALNKIKNATSLAQLGEPSMSGTHGPYYLLTVKLFDGNLMEFLGVISEADSSIVFLEATVISNIMYGSFEQDLEQTILDACKKENVKPYRWSAEEKKVAEYDPQDDSLIYLDEFYVESAFDDLKAAVIKEVTAYSRAAEQSGTATASPPPQSTSQQQGVMSVDDAINFMRQTGGEVSVQNELGVDIKTGLVVEIVHDWNQGGKLRARTNDGQYGRAWVQFPNSARQEGAIFVIPKYLVEFRDRGFYSVSSKLHCDQYRVR